MKISELRELTEGEIREKIGSWKEELFNFRFRKKFGQLEDPSKIRSVKKEIARALTVIREKDSGVNSKKANQ
ncbi:MAG: 50S ribosomal protein L29 [Fibrobacterota bacterium]